MPVASLRRDVRVEREKLRALIRGRVHLEQIAKIVSWLTQGYEPVKDIQMGTITEVPLDSNRIAALRAALDAHFRLINKVLPDLKAVELTGEDGQALPTGNMDKLALATKLLALMRDTDGAEVELPDFLQ